MRRRAWRRSPRNRGHSRCDRVLGTVPPAPCRGYSQGRPGIAVAGKAHVVATPVAAKTRVQLIRDRDRVVLRARVLPGKLGVPQITFSGIVEGTWAKGRRLLLSTSMYDSSVSHEVRRARHANAGDAPYDRASRRVRLRCALARRKAPLRDPVPERRERPDSLRRALAAALRRAGSSQVRSSTRQSRASR